MSGSVFYLRPASSWSVLRRAARDPRARRARQCGGECIGQGYRAESGKRATGLLTPDIPHTGRAGGISVLWIGDAGALNYSFGTPEGVRQLELIAKYPVVNFRNQIIPGLVLTLMFSLCLIICRSPSAHNRNSFSCSSFRFLETLRFLICSNSSSLLNNWRRY